MRQTDLSEPPTQENPSCQIVLQASDPWHWLTNAPDREIPLLTSVLLIAKDEYPGLDVPACLARFDAWQVLLSSRLEPGAEIVDSLRKLNHFMFEELGFSGNFMDYYDPRNSFLNDVFERKLGIPISLSVLYVALGRSLGMPVDGVSFPGHFLVSVAIDGGVIVIDPFQRGKSIGSHELKLRARAAGVGDEFEESQLFELLAPATNRAMLVRMLYNLKASFLERKDTLRALRICHRLVQLTGSDLERRDRGMLYLEMGAGAAASADLRHYLDENPKAEDAEAVQAAMVSAQLLPRAS
jgi:regulator of sirC expression with transglutaminase-like and TPR domain